MNSPSSSSSSYFNNLQTSASQIAKNMTDAYELAKPYMDQIQRLSTLISNTNISDTDKATAIIDIIMAGAANQVTQMASQTCATSQNPLIRFICNLNTYKKQICSVVDILANSYTQVYTQIKLVFDFITTNPVFIDKLKNRVNLNEIQNIINNPVLSTSTSNVGVCETQINNMLNQLINRGGKNKNNKKKMKSKRQIRSRQGSKKRRTIRKR